MSNELIPSQPTPNPAPFARGSQLSAAVNAGAVSVEQERAIAEAQGQLTLAKRFPRDLTSAHAELMTACKSPAFAAVAFYSKPQGGSTVTGPSIRMAEEIARVVGNFQYGHRELSRDGKKSEVEVFAWDMEKNNYAKRQLTIMHVRDTREGPKPLRDQVDIDMKINNVASKQVRGLILAMMPKWLVEDAVQECKKTIAGNNDEPMETRVRRMTQAFAKFGVKPEHLEKRLGHKLDAMMLDELVEFQGIYNAIKEGEPASEFFGDQETAEANEKTADAIKEVVSKAAEKTRTKAPTQAPAPAAEPAAAPVQGTQTATAEQQAKSDEAIAPAQAPAPASSRRTGATAQAAAPAPAPAPTQQAVETAQPETNGTDDGGDVF